MLHSCCVKITKTLTNINLTWTQEYFIQSGVKPLKTILHLDSLAILPNIFTKLLLNWVQQSLPRMSNYLCNLKERDTFDIRREDTYEGCYRNFYWLWKRSTRCNRNSTYPIAKHNIFIIVIRSVYRNSLKGFEQTSFRSLSQQIILKKM